MITGWRVGVQGPDRLEGLADIGRLLGRLTALDVVPLGEPEVRQDELTDRQPSDSGEP